MDEFSGGRIDQSVEEQFDEFSDVLETTHIELLSDFFDADTMADQRTIDTCRRMEKYFETSAPDDTFNSLVGINFAVTMAKLAGYKTDKLMDFLPDTLTGLEAQDYTQARQQIHDAVDEYFEDNPTTDGFTEAYILMFDEEQEAASQEVIEAVKDARRLSSGLTFLALDQQAAIDDMNRGSVSIQSLIG